MSSTSQKYIRGIISALIIWTLAAALLYLSLCIPKNIRWWNNYYESYNELVEEGDYPHIIKWGEQKWDNYTAALFLNMLYFFDHRHPLKTGVSMELATANIEGKTYVYNNLGAMLEGDTVDNWYYSRYWGGYNIILYLFLFAASVNTLRLILFYTSLLLHAYLIFFYWRKKCFSVSIAFGISSIMGHWLFNSMCIVYGIDIVLALLTIASWTGVKDKIDPVIYGFIVGGLTMFFCMLSTPLIVLGMWLVVESYEDIGDSQIKRMTETIKISAAWVAGYAIMMEIKGLLGNMTGVEATANSRMMVLIGHAGIVERIRTSLMLFLRFAYRWVWLILIVFIVFVCLTIKKKISIKEIKNRLYLLIVAIYPFLWEFIFNGHTNHGAEKTLYVISVFACMVPLLSGLDKKSEAG